MSKNVSLPKMAGVLTLFCVVSAAFLAWVYSITEKPIAEASNRQRNESIAAVLPDGDFTNVPSETPVSVEIPGVSGDTMTLYVALYGDSIAGAAVETWSDEGFGGHISLMVGFDAVGNVIDYAVLSHAETPGLGAKMNDWFRSAAGHRSILGRNPLDNGFGVSKDGGDVDAITGATITSRAFIQAVRRASEVFEIYKNSRRKQ